MAELIWDGKYDKNGKRVAPLRVSLPFQTVETVNESAQERQRTLDLFSTGRDPEWRNRLIWGDKKYVLPSLLPEFAGKVDLIYIDPPFATGQDFSFQLGLDDHQFVKEPSVIETKAYRDTWGHGLDGYLRWFYETAVQLREIIADSGSLYVQVDWHVGHYVKVILDEVFGEQNFRNDITWQRTSAHANVSQRYGSVYDRILFYTASDSFTWNQQYAPYDKDYLETFFDQTDPDGRRYARRDLTASMSRASRGQIYTWKGVTPPPSRCWAMTKDRMDELEAAGRIHWPQKATGMPRLKLYPEDLPGTPLQDVWTDIRPIHNLSSERAAYPTQKPVTLIERIARTSSNHGDLILDCFCGSGTSMVAAERVDRRWIGADLSRFAIHVTRKRLLSTSNVRPFVVQNLGKYERQLWQGEEFGERADLAYRRFILNLYHAQPLDGYAWLHGLKYGHLIHVGSVDAPVSTGDITQIAIEYRRVMGSGENAPQSNRIDILGWDFAFELNEVAKQQAALANIDFHFVRIPREVLEKKAVEQGDIKFFELAALSVDAKQKDRTAFLTLTDFVIPLDDVPEDVQRAITHWSQWIDYWAVDWDNKSDTFHNQWQTYRTRKCPELQTSTSYTYDDPGLYTVVVKVIDILGNDTTKTLRIEVL